MNAFKKSLCAILVTILLFSTSAAYASLEDIHYLSSDSCALLDALINGGLTTSIFKSDSSARAAFAYIASYALSLENVIDSDFVAEAALYGEIYVALRDEQFVLFIEASNRLVVLFHSSIKDNNFCCYSEITDFKKVSLPTLITDSGFEYCYNVSIMEFLGAGTTLSQLSGS